MGEAFTTLTSEPGPDVAPYHNRQVVVLDRTDWASWLDPFTGDSGRQAGLGRLVFILLDHPRLVLGRVDPFHHVRMG